MLYDLEADIASAIDELCEHVFTYLCDILSAGTRNVAISNSILDNQDLVTSLVSLSRSGRDADLARGQARVSGGYPVR